MGTQIYLRPSQAAVLAAAAFAVPAAASGVPAGVLIENTATATYTANSATQSVDSNTVTLKVDEVVDVATASQESGPVAATATAVLRFKVTNTGNGPEAFTLTANPAVTGNSFNATVTGLALDVNGNGVYDAGVDTALTNGATSASLAADGPLDVLVLVSIPASAPASATSRVELTALSTTGSGPAGTLFAGAGVSGGDAVIGASTATATAQAILTVDKAVVSLVKSASIADPFGGTRPVPSATITYSIVANVTGTGSVASLAVTDAIPAGTTYQAGSLTLEGAAVTDAADADAGQASASGLSVQLGTLAAGTTRTVTFKVRIN
ncbi:MAG: hypothetical protein EOP59_17485 [Sphingomonadales bacterium]|nr:MAG: hypothetical protein EOP59_17485 [Sphingomonadales bacterium]